MEENDAFGINEALMRLDEGDVIVFMSAGKKNYAVKKGGDVILACEGLKAQLTLNDFLALYKDVSFAALDLEEETCDPVKDDEYYSWGRKGET